MAPSPGSPPQNYDNLGPDAAELIRQAIAQKADAIVAPDWVPGMMQKLGMYDLFLIDETTGEVVYTVEKEADFATNLETGPLRNSNLARAFRMTKLLRRMLDETEFLSPYGIRGISDSGSLVVRLYDGPLMGINHARSAYAAMNEAQLVMYRSFVEGTSKDDTQVVLGKFLSPNLFVSYGISIAEAINTIKLRYSLNERWSLKAEAGIEQSADIEYRIER